MKQLIIAFLVTCLSVSVPAQSNIDVLHYRFEIFLNDESDSISGKATIKVLFLKESNELLLDLNNVSKGKGMSVFSVVDSIDEKKLLATTHTANKLKITFPGKKNAGDTKTITIRYKGIPTDGLIISKNKYGNRTFFADNWPNRAHHWIPCVDDPADKATVEFIVTAPSHYQVISNGVQIEETNLPGNLPGRQAGKKLTHYKEDVPLPTKVMAIGAADFAVNTVGEVNCIPVSSWVYPENKAEGFYDYAMAKDILAFHINYIGPYAYKKLANVQSKTKYGGMENAGAIFYAEYSVSGQRLEEELLSHEIVHQWFGNMATEKSFAHFWLSEGFATYLTHVYIESKYGTDSMNTEMRTDRDKVIGFVKTSRRPVVDSTPNYMQLLNANSYQKGSWVLHMLRRQLGDSIFHQSIRQYYATYAGKNADTKDLQKIFEMVSGKRLDKFFRQWLYTPVNPELKITWRYLAKEKKVMIIVEQVQQSEPFEFPLEIALGFAHLKPQLQKLMITKKVETFSFSASSNQVSIFPDPFTSLLFEGKVTELK